jgi:hypothetical protein
VMELLGGRRRWAARGHGRATGGRRRQEGRRRVMY